MPTFNYTTLLVRSKTMTAKKSINGTYEMATLFFSVNVGMVRSFSQTDSVSAVRSGVHGLLFIVNRVQITMLTITSSAVKVKDW